MTPTRMKAGPKSAGLRKATRNKRPTTTPGLTRARLPRMAISADGWIDFKLLRRYSAEDEEPEERGEGYGKEDEDEETGD